MCTFKTYKVIYILKSSLILMGLFPNTLLCLSLAHLIFEPKSECELG